MSLWIIIARNELRIRTAKFKSHRKLFFIIVFALFLFWAMFLGPVFFNAVFPEIISLLSGVLEFVLQFVIEYFLMTIFIIFILYPIFTLFRKSEIGIKDVILSSPVKSGDIFLGEFFGQLPFIFLIVLAIGPLAVSLLSQANPQLTVVHYIIIYLVIFLLMTFSLIIGTILANWIELKVSSNNRNSSSINSYLLLLSFIVIISFYFFHYVFDLAYNNPLFKNWLSIFPSFWYSNIILYVINPTLTQSYIVNIWLSIILAIGIPLIFFFFSYKKAEKFNSYEPQLEKNLSIKEQEGIFSKIIKRMTRKRYKIVVMVQLKNFLRKRENVTKLIYSVAFTGVLGLFIFLSLSNPLTSIKDYILMELVSIPVKYFDILVVSIISWMGGLIFGMMMGISSIHDSKDILYLYKKSARGVNTSIYAFLYLMTSILLLYSIILTIFFTILFSLNIVVLGFFFSTYFIHGFIYLVQLVGLQCIRPFYGESGKQIYFKIYFIGVLQVISLLISLFITIPLFPVTIDYSLGFSYILLTNIGISAAIAFVMLLYGLFKLNRAD
ncbi:MAG: hypothetical protein ACTSO8_06100 [Promethearchaeota archaeon]